jgi:hypothetical protein
VGLPYEGRAGAYWLLLGPDVEHRRTDYDFDRAIALLRAGGNPAPTSCSSLSPSLGFFQQVGWRQRRGRLPRRSRQSSPRSSSRTCASGSDEHAQTARATMFSFASLTAASYSPAASRRPARPPRSLEQIFQCLDCLALGRERAVALESRAIGLGDGPSPVSLAWSTSSGGSGNPPCSRARTAGGRRRAGPHADRDRRSVRPPGRRS